MRLESSIKELMTCLWILPCWWENQGGMIDRIESNMDQSVGFVERAVADTKKAAKFQQEARRKQMMIFCCCVILALILGFWFVYKSNLAGLTTALPDLVLGVGGGSRALGSGGSAVRCSGTPPECCSAASPLL
ncbi:hypothetical protein F7725_005137 [Dissostichus mawsoni]|uniref:t-SNARE coiled-coil homology domain-containing protein n=1 Tax=Dissostichus mawsoni TaxID=36200 RepID=A0A7J5YQE0_DISMA|nr:hypothetical protein F7725_005137 [Dissostichus mawsoni]